MKKIFIFFFIFLFVASSAYAACMTDYFGKIICPKAPYTGIAVDSLGKLKCGPGDCVKTLFSGVMCSAMPGGAIAVNTLGQLVCQEGCVKASEENCTQARR